MAPKRRERVAPPPPKDGWEFRYATNAAATGWTAVCDAAPDNARGAWERLTVDPRGRNERQHPLKGGYATRTIEGRVLEQWQYEVTGGGRLWYCIDDSKRTVWLTEATLGHPKATE